MVVNFCFEAVIPEDFSSPLRLWFVVEEDKGGSSPPMPALSESHWPTDLALFLYATLWMEITTMNCLVQQPAALDLEIGKHWHLSCKT